MATLVHQCPHTNCLTEKMNFEVARISYAPGGGRNVRNFVQTSCRACAQPVSFEIADASGSGQFGMGHEGYPLSIEQMGWRVVRVWPEIPKPNVPADLPEQVARAYLSAERNFHQRDMEEAAAGSYGRALDVGTKLFAADLEKLTLYNRIKKLAEQHRITADLAAWADAIRLVRNDALHVPDAISRDQLVAIRGFSEMVLTYLFTLPAMLKARQAKTKEKP